MAQDERIRLRGVRQHNLKNLDLDIPLYRLIAISGVSGSGKSSLALHTLYAEGQRRYVETFSPYARQFLERMDPPEADLIDGIPPSIAIESGTAVRSSRSTVGTITEINDYLKLLFARLAVPHCPRCGEPVFQDNPESVYHKLQSLPAGSRLLVTFPFAPQVSGRTAGRDKATGSSSSAAANPLPVPREWSRPLLAQGFLRIYHNGQTRDLESLTGEELEGLFSQEVLVVVDRLSWGRVSAERVKDSLTTAFKMGNNRLAVVVLAAFRGHRVPGESRAQSPVTQIRAQVVPLLDRGIRGIFGQAPRHQPLVTSHSSLVTRHSSLLHQLVQLGSELRGLPQRGNDPAADPEPFLLQQPARRLSRVPGVRADHRRRSRSGDTGSAPVVDPGSGETVGRRSGRVF